MTINFNYPLSQALIQLCQDANLRLAAAESCTGGSLSEVLTAVPGSSQVFDCGFITYSDDSKQACLNVDNALIKQHGAVSAQVAAAMATGALTHSQADIAISITGIAGPDGGSNDKPVGTVWFGVAQRQSEVVSTEQRLFTSGRKHIRRKATQFALEWLLSTCQQRVTSSN